MILLEIPKVYLVFDALDGLDSEGDRFAQSILELEGLKPGSVKLRAHHHGSVRSGHFFAILRLQENKYSIEK